MVDFSSQTGTRRRDDIDTIRAIACVALVSFHVVGAGSDAGLRLPADHWLSLLNLTFTDMRMPLFSFISGFVFVAWSGERGAGAVLCSKARRLLIPMLVVGALFWAVRSAVVGPQGPLWQITVLPYAHFWYLQATFVLMAALIGAVWVMHGQERPVAAVLLALLVLGWLWAPRAPLNLFSINNTLYIGPFFYAGFLLARSHRAMAGLLGGGARRRVVGTMLVILAVLIGALLAAKILTPAPVMRRALTLGIGAAACAGLLLIRPQVEWMARLARASYAIYLFHVFFTAGTRVALQQIWPDVPPELIWPVALMFGILGPIALQQALITVPWLGFAFLGLRLRPPARVMALDSVGVPGTVSGPRFDGARGGNRGVARVGFLKHGKQSLRRG